MDLKPTEPTTTTTEPATASEKAVEETPVAAPPVESGAMMKKKMGKARPLKVAKAAAPARTLGGAAPRRVMATGASRAAGASRGRAGSSSRVTSGAGARGVSRGAAASGAGYNDAFKKQLKSTAIDLRKTGADIEEEPTIELSLLMDCTCSMSSWITKAKKTLHEIIDKTIKECEEDGKLKMRVSFVGYRDIKDTRRFEVKDFSEDIDSVKKFIESVKADGGADEPEDTQGGLKLCLLQDWTEEAAKRVIIITDAPPHGRLLNNGGDDYPNGSPEGLHLADLMKEFCKKDIDFQVIKLNNSVDKMIGVMKENHQEVEVVDMSGAQMREEIRAARMAEVEESAGTCDAEELKVRRAAAEAAPSMKEIEYEMEKKFIDRTSKGLSMKMKMKRGKC